MRNLVICKACGYVMDEKNLKDVCPACGVPRTAFIEYKPKVSEKRAKILGMHLHPITVHFPEALSVLMVGFTFIALITPANISVSLMFVNLILCIIFPVTIIIASISGIYDGKIRFKKLSPPLLRTKISLGIALFLVSIVMLNLLLIDYTRTDIMVMHLIVSFVGLVLSVALGKIGGRLMDAVMPG